MTNNTITRVNGSTLTSPADFHLRGGTSPRSSAALEAEIARTRADLGETAAVLVSRADVKTRLRAKAADVADRAATTVRRPVPVAVLTAVVTAATVAVVLIRRGRP